QLTLNLPPFVAHSSPSQILPPINSRSKMLSSSQSNLGYFLCEEVSQIETPLPALSEWSVWQNESCTLASRASPSFDRGASDSRSPRGNPQSCTNLADNKKRVKRVQSPLCSSMRGSQCSSSCASAEIDGECGCGFGCAQQQVQQSCFVVASSLLDSQCCLLDDGIESSSIHPHPCSSPCAHAQQCSFACGGGYSSYIATPAEQTSFET
ncbi:hypothetical protein PFISCL1PPCAC_1315, partial [Pristionchus fissidentatus]